MNERLYCFKYAGKVEYLSIAQARLIDDPAIKYRIEEIILNSRTKRMKKDGFEPGWQENIREYVGGRAEYDHRLAGRVVLCSSQLPWVVDALARVPGHAHGAGAGDHGLAIPDLPELRPAGHAAGADPVVSDVHGPVLGLDHGQLLPDHPARSRGCGARGSLQLDQHDGACVPAGGQPGPGRVRNVRVHVVVG